MRTNPAMLAVSPNGGADDCYGTVQLYTQSSVRRAITGPLAVLDDLSDAPAEAIAYALAHSIFELKFDSDSTEYCLRAADKILARLRALGFDIVPMLQADVT